MLPRALLWAYAVVSVAEVAATLAGSRPAVYATKPLLMLLLVAWVVADARCRSFAWPGPLRLLVVGAGFAWVGDVFLMVDGDGWFVAGIAAFAVMQACYLAAFVRVPGPGLVRAWWIAAIPYVLVWLAINVLVWPGAGSLRVPVVVYSAIAIAMALAALDLVLRVPRRLGWRVARGAGLFVASDAQIALTAFGPHSASRAWDGVIMTTYVLAQAMIVTGFTRAMRD